MSFTLASTVWTRGVLASIGAHVAVSTMTVGPSARSIDAGVFALAVKFGVTQLSGENAGLKERKKKGGSAIPLHDE
jgi:hypothetical protein